MSKKQSGLGTAAFFDKPAEQQNSRTAEQSTSIPEEQLDNTPVQQPTSTVAQSPASKTVNQRSANVTTALGQYVNTPKDKATYYLGRDTMEAIDEYLPMLKRLAGKQRKLVTKSLVVEAALQAIFADLEANQTESALAKKMAEL